MDKNIMIGGIAVLVIIAVALFVFMTPATDSTDSYIELKEIWGNYGVLLEEQPLLTFDALNSMSKADFVQLKTKLMNFKTAQTDAEMIDLAELYVNYADYLIINMELADIINQNYETIYSVDDDIVYCTNLDNIKKETTLSHQQAETGAYLKNAIIVFSSNYSSLSSNLKLSDDEILVVFHTPESLIKLDNIIAQLEENC